MKREKITTRDLVFTGMMTAVLSVLSILEIPMPTGVPITLQTFSVALCGYVLGWRLGAVSALLYLLLGAAGVPVYSGMHAGLGILIGPTGGFIFGFIPMAAACGLGAVKGFRGRSAVCGLLGLTVCHLLGAAQFTVVMETTFGQALLLVSLPYLVKDVLSVVGAGLIAASIRKALPYISRKSYKQPGNKNI